MVEQNPQQNAGNQNQIVNQDANDIQVIENWRIKNGIVLIDQHRESFLAEIVERIDQNQPPQQAAIICKRYLQRDDTEGFRALDIETNFYTEVAPHEGLLAMYQAMNQGRINDPENPNVQFIALQYCENGKLTKYIYNNPLALKYCRYIMRKLIHIFQHLHTNRYCHLSFSIDQICFDENYNIKVIDFRFCQRAVDNNFVFQLAGGFPDTVNPPEFGVEEFELIEIDGIKADIYFLGVVLKNLISGCDPEQQFDGNAYHEQLLRSLLHEDPTQRPTLQQILNHQFLTGAADASNEDFFEEFQQRRERPYNLHQQVIDLGDGDGGLVRGGEQDNNVVNLPQRAPIRTHFLVKSDRTHDNLMDIICDISGRVFQQDFETEPAEDYYFIAKHEEKGLAIRVEILDSQVKDRVIVEVKRIYGSNLTFLAFYHALIKGFA